MPLFSRRKSETNLQAPSGRSPRPPGASRAFDAGEAVNPAPDARKARSRSSTREQRATRPERDVPPVPMKGSTLGPELENWNSESPTTRARSNLPPGAMPSRPPSAQYHAVTTSTPSPSTRAPLRQSSLGPIPAAHDSSFASTSSYSPAQTPNSQISSPVLHTSPDQLVSPPQNLSSSLRVVSTDPRYFHTPPRRSSRQDSTNPPISSSAKFARSFSTSNQSTDGGGFDYTSAADGVIAMASSSSFYAGSPHQNGNGSSYSTPAQSPTASPRSSQLPHRQSSLIHAALTESLEHSPSIRQSGSPRGNLPSAPPPAPPKMRDTPPPVVPSKSPRRTIASLPVSPVPIPARTNHLDAPLGSPGASSLLSVPRNRSNQSIFDKSSSTSEDEGALTENTSIDGFTPPSKQSQFDSLAPALPIKEQGIPPPVESFEPLPVDTTPPRSVPLAESKPQPPVDIAPLGRSQHGPTGGRGIMADGNVHNFNQQRKAAESYRAATQFSEHAPPATPTRPPRLPAPISPTSVSPQFHLRSPSTSPRRVRTKGSSSSLKASPTRAVALAAARERERKENREIPLPRKEEEESFSHGLPAATPKPPVVPHEDAPKKRPRSSMEVAFSLCSRQILGVVLPFLSYRDVVSLRQTSKALRFALETDGRELILERFLGGQGYRSFAPGADAKRRTFLPADDLVTLDLRDLSVFRLAQTLTLDDYSRFSRAYIAGQISSSKLRLARATTRAWNRVVLRLRSQSVLPASSFAPPSFPDLRQVKQPVYKPPRAPQLRVWVPTYRGESWMNDQEVVECERELWRSGKGAWAQLRKGDIVTNVAIESFGNFGKTIFDGRFLRDLSFEFDVIGHLPGWLNMLTFSPSYFHGVIASSTSNPVFYLSLAPFVQRLQETLRLESEKVSLASPQGKYQVKKHVYRGVIEIQPGKVLESSTGERDGPGGFEACHPEWAGRVYLETEGTTEHASLLIARVASRVPTPYKVLREKCRPGRLVITPVLDK